MRIYDSKDDQLYKDIRSFNDYLRDFIESLPYRMFAAYERHYYSGEDVNSPSIKAIKLLERIFSYGTKANDVHVISEDTEKNANSPPPYSDDSNT